MAETEQITETEAPIADAPVDGPATVDELDALLAEFDQATNANQPVDPAAVQNQREIEIAHHLSADAYQQLARVNAEKAEVEQAAQELWERQNAEKETEVLRTIRGNLDIDDRELRSFVIGRALDDPSINQTWGTWRQNPGALSRMVSKLHDELEQHVEQQREKFLSKEFAADRFAVSQAVRGQGGKVPPEPPPDFGRMTDAEIHAWKKANMPGY